MLTTEAVLEAPVAQVIGDDLTGVNGVVLTQVTQVVDAVMASVGGAYEAANMYLVQVLPPETHIALTHEDKAAWLPSQEEVNALPNVYFVEERSSCLLRVCLAMWGGLNLRAMHLLFHQQGGAGQEGPRYIVRRPCRLGGSCCCPLTMVLEERGEMVGMVVEDFDSYCVSCYQQCCLCTCTHKVMVGNKRASLVHKYSLRSSCCCCGRVNNCCGSTCCKANLFVDILDPKGGLVTAVQKTFGAPGCSNCCRCCYLFNTYIIPFPHAASHVERLLLLTGVFSIDLAYFSRQGGENN